MRLPASLTVFIVFVLAAVACVGGAAFAVDQIETRSARTVAKALRAGGHDWAHVAADGLQLELTGIAPSEAVRFRALSVANSVVDASRVIDAMDVVEARAIEAPTFSVEILRNDEGISLIGLLPAAQNRDTLRDSLGDIGNVTDLLETADFPKPEGWDAALSFAVDALSRLPRSKISVSADRVAVTAITDSTETKRRVETELARRAPDSFRLALDVSAPRPAITPFALRFLKDAETARFDACSADTAETREQILRAAVAAGFSGKADCTIGLGVPSPRWGEAVAMAIGALDAFGAGSVTFSDADVTLVAKPGTALSTFDRTVGELENTLPDAVSLHAVLPEPVEIDGSGETEKGPPEFVATRSPEGQVQLRGRLTDERARAAVESYAMANFGAEEVSNGTRLDPELPDGWPLRVLAALEAMDYLVHGAVVVQPDFVDLKGVTGNNQADAEISRLLSENLGEAQNYAIDVRYDEALDPQAALPTPEECVSRINTMIAGDKITFSPGSVTVDASARKTIDAIAEVLRQCESVQMEIGGHTDSQGRETMNQQLSQSRAEAVLDALRSRRVLTSNLDATGYGEAAPIADNDTEAGREANRRIEFKLIMAEEETAEAEDTPPERSSEPEPESEQN